jgi:hypothetical protein
MGWRFAVDPGARIANAVHERALSFLERQVYTPAYAVTIVRRADWQILRRWSGLTARIPCPS